MKLALNNQRARSTQTDAFVAFYIRCRERGIVGSQRGFEAWRRFAVANNFIPERTKSSLWVVKHQE